MKRIWLRFRSNVKKGLTIIPVAHVDEVIALALVRKPEPIDWDDALNDVAKPGDEAAASLLPH